MILVQVGVDLAGQEKRGCPALAPTGLPGEYSDELAQPEPITVTITNAVARIGPGCQTGEHRCVRCLNNAHAPVFGKVNPFCTLTGAFGSTFEPQWRQKFDLPVVAGRCRSLPVLRY